MARLTPKTEILRALLARSGNQCAFPNCTHPIVNEENKLIAQLCHIEGAEKGGERYNPNQTDEARRNYENLLFLCYRHHIETNDIEKYTVSKLKEIKEKHEKQFIEKPFDISEYNISLIKDEITSFWKTLKVSYEESDIIPEDLKLEVDFDSNILDILDLHYKLLDSVFSYFEYFHKSDRELLPELKKLISEIGSGEDQLQSIPYYANPFASRNWELHNLGTPNLQSRIVVSINQIEIRILEMLILKEPSNIAYQQRLAKIRTEFENIIKMTGYVD